MVERKSVHQSIEELATNRFEVMEERCSQSIPPPWNRDFSGRNEGTLERRGGWRRFQKRILLILLPSAAPKQRPDPEQESHFKVS